MRRARRRDRAGWGLRTLLAAAVALGATASASPAAQPLGDQVQISQAGADGDAARDADNPSAAFNPVTGQALAVWGADDAADDKVEIFGRLVNADGLPQGGQFRIGTAGPAGDANWDASDPRVAYNSVRNEFLVVWMSEEQPVDLDYEIRGQRVGPAGDLRGSSARVSDMGPGNASFNAGQPQLAYNATRDEYVVVWHGVNDSLPDRHEVWARRVSGTGAPQGDDVRISATRNTGSAWATIAYNSRDNEYLVAWIGKDSPTEPVSQRTFVQRLTADTALVGGNRQIFQAGEVHKPAIVYNPNANEYLVATPGIVAGDIEAYVQRLNAAGEEIGTDDARISRLGPDGAPDYGLMVDVAVGYSPRSDEYLVTWSGDTTGFGLVRDEMETFGQGLNGAGAEVGLDDFPISSMGPDGSAQFGVTNFQFTGPLAYVPDRDRFLMVWSGDDGPPLADNEVEVYGRMIATTPAAAISVPGVVTPPSPRRQLKVMPKFTPLFATRARGRRGVRGSLYGISGLGSLPYGTKVTLSCERRCAMKSASIVVRPRGKQRKTSLKLRRPVRVTALSRVRVTARHSGYVSRYVRFRFVRTAIGVLARRAGGGCRTPTKRQTKVACVPRPAP